jgi:hypothetical protein
VLPLRSLPLGLRLELRPLLDRRQLDERRAQRQRKPGANDIILNTKMAKNSCHLERCMQDLVSSRDLSVKSHNVAFKGTEAGS